jgi:dolichyl-phosphate-mannose--protein O-mannosyl transferase
VAQVSLITLILITDFEAIGDLFVPSCEYSHFGTFVDNLLSREVLFDIHPPLGKLTLAGLGHLAGYRPVDGFGYEEIGKEYGSVLYYPLREIAAVFGTVTVPLIYITSRELGVSWVGSLLAASLYCFDNLNIIESRLILMDSQIMFYLILSLYCALRLWKTPEDTWQRFLWLTLTGAVSGFSMSVKWTALATPALIAIISFFGLHFLNEPLALLECAWASITGISVYVFFFWVHFRIVIKDGPGTPFFPAVLRQTLIGHETYEPSAPKPGFWSMFWYTNKTMLSANASITTRHRWESYWYWWVVNWRGLLYFNRQEPETGKWASVYLLCNPIVCWFCAACVAIMATAGLFTTRYRRGGFGIFCGKTGAARQKALSTCLFLMSGWLVNLLPYILVDRSAFVYHYLPGLLYAQLLGGVMVDQLPRRIGIVSMATTVCAAVGGFCFFAPWTYCVPLTSEQHAQMRWFGRWD